MLLLSPLSPMIVMIVKNTMRENPRVQQSLTMVQPHQNQIT